MMKKILLTLLILSSSAYALPNGNYIYMSGLVSSSRLKIANTMPTINYNSFTDVYNIPTNIQSSFAGGLRGGYEFSSFGQGVSFDLGLGVYTGSSYEYYGTLVETADGDPDSTLYNFRFNIRSIRVMAETQLNLLFGNISPFINGGIGPAWNNTQQYTEYSSNDSNYPPLPPFKNKTRTSMAWQVGLGISYVFAQNPDATPNQRLALGYQYVNLGQSETGERGDEYPYSLIPGAITANEIYFSYTHLF